MIHTKRRWYVSPVENTETLAEKLTQHSWTLCTGFALQGTLFLNDSTSEDGAQEYAIYGEGNVMWRCTRPYRLFRHFVSINFT